MSVSVYWYLSICASARLKEINPKGRKPQGRSSHSVDVIGNVAYVFGGEHQPRIPIGSDVWCLDVVSRTWSKMDTSGIEFPERNAHASAVVGSSIYIFGGRQGIAMGEGALFDLYCLDTETGTWSQLTGTGDVPEARSYHAMASIGHTLYVFGGCASSGRLNDLHAFDVKKGTWTKLNTCPTIAKRGGAGLTSVGTKLFVVGGFTGEEAADVYEFDTETKQWRQVTPLPEPRSVFGIVTLGEKIVVIGGEVDPSSEGHNGAGAFSNDVYVLDTRDEKKGWQRLAPQGNVTLPPRGWFSAAALSDDSAIVFGGNAVDNSRLADTFILEIAN